MDINELNMLSQPQHFIKLEYHQTDSGRTVTIVITRSNINKSYILRETRGEKVWALHAVDDGRAVVRYIRLKELGLKRHHYARASKEVKL